ncbi:serine/threonine-protein kinase pakB isoform X2 [Melanotaenia boesemani]|uniref:serine/threonine-protein kinase pakB isoform X2 n=1 Tax=Melanotaenia boesemani TaxID=1250792 RepID=UPI001C058E16|nr:serine/threonine-protein kinase pakB isoform X2 [Melanotaenia boesemani]
MGNGRKASCVLCQRSEESNTTGALSTKDQVTAHQDCLLYSSGIYSTASPAYDDLFGFSVADVLEEVKRGSRLICYHCKKKGATVGCEVKRCKKSFHYPCAVDGGDKPFEDKQHGKYGLYCLHHYEQSETVNGLRKPQTSKNPKEAGPLKTFCLTCEKTEGNISLDSLSKSIVMSYCDKHAPSSYKRQIDSNDEPSRAGPSSYSSASSSETHCSSKRRLSFHDEGEEEPVIRRKYKRKRTISVDSLNSDVSSLIPPIESDMDESVNSLPQHQPTVPQQLRQEPERPTDSLTGNQPISDYADVISNEDDTIIDSDAESESLLPPVKNHIEVPSEASALTASTPQPHTVSVQVQTIKKEYGGSSLLQSPAHSPEQNTCWPSVPQQNCAAPLSPPSPSSPPSEPSKLGNVTDSPPRTTAPATSPAPPEPNYVTLLPSPSLPLSPAPPSDFPSIHPSDPESNIDSINFWRSCNTAGCTQDILTDFINKMNDIFSRIQTDQASKEDYDRALSVMAASGKLAEFVAKQQEELQRKQMELQKAAEAMKEMVSALKK